MNESNFKLGLCHYQINISPLISEYLHLGDINYDITLSADALAHTRCRALSKHSADDKIIHDFLKLSLDIRFLNYISITKWLVYNETVLE